jgi:hypothetical protein
MPATPARAFARDSTNAGNAGPRFCARFNECRQRRPRALRAIQQMPATPARAFARDPMNAGNAAPRIARDSTNAGATTFPNLRI